LTRAGTSAAIRIGPRRLGLAGLSLAAALPLACAISLPPPQTPAPPPPAASAAWSEVLTRFVDGRGRIDFQGIAREPGALERYVAFLAGNGPTATPAAFRERADVLAYWLNAYNALAMYGVVRSGIPPDLEPIKVRFFYRNRFRLDGRSLSLYALENRIVRPLGDPRIHFALNCMVRGCPRLPREPFEAARLDAQLDAAARLFVSEERNVRPDPAAKKVFLSAIFDFYTKDFLAKASSLAAYVNLYRESPVPAEWKVEFLPYDWTLNRP
jgi:hypothetical protein